MDTEQIINLVVAVLGGAPAPLITYGISKVPQIAGIVTGNEAVVGSAAGFLLLAALGYFTESDMLEAASFGAAGKLGADLIDKFVVKGMLDKGV